MISGIILFYAWLVWKATYVALPDRNVPVHFYSNQTRQDIKLIFYRAFQQAQQSIFVSVYGITDPEILSVFNQKVKSAIPIHIEYDPSASSSLKKNLSPLISLQPIKGKGLMHRKIVSLDHSQIFLGSANLTTSSLRHHDNLVIGIHAPFLAQFLEKPTATFFSTDLKEQKGEIFLFPDPEQLGLKRLLEVIHKAKFKIVIAMFTLTYSPITEALIQAKSRGVDITVAADYFTAKGASKNTLEVLKKSGIPILSSQGRQLLHHKWALIDDEILVMGSANWTKAAFSKNHDFLFFLFPLQKEQIKFLKKLWKVIQTESIFLM